MNAAFYLAKSRVARASKRYRRLATLAQTVITLDPHNIEAWSNLALALYALRHYQGAFEATLAASCISIPSDMRNKLLQLLRSCEILHRLENPRISTPTTRLKQGWYKARLEHLIETNQLHAYPTVTEMNSYDALPKANMSDCAIVYRQSGPNNQNAWEQFINRDGGTRVEFPLSLLLGFPLDQTTGGYIFLKERVSSFGCDCYDEGCAPCEECRDEYSDLLIPKYRFPKFNIPLPSQVEVVGGPLLCVHVANGLVSSQTQNALVEHLGRLGAERQDCPVPRYQNIIDPNIGSENGVWVPTEFDVEEVPADVALNALEDALEDALHRHGRRATIPREVVNQIHQLAGSPRYGRCRIRSSIPDLDPHKHAPLYVAFEHVLNASLPMLANLRHPALLLPGPLQVVIKAQSIVLEANDKYEGVWHEDGFREHIVAVVLYYYGKSTCLKGGAMEVASKRRLLTYVGDGEGYYFDPDGVREAIVDMNRCIVPVEQGTMLVFSNYAAVHRVLPMIAEGEGGSRDFVAFFVVDQKFVLDRPETLTPREERVKRRMGMLREQLQTRGHFGMDGSQVFSTGNGSLCDLAWIRSGEVFPRKVIRWLDYPEADACFGIVSRLNMTPPLLGRGCSFLTKMDLPAVDFNPASCWMLHILREEPRIETFVDTMKMRYTTRVPENGIRGVRLFDRIAEWRGLGFWTDEDSIREKIGELT